MKYCPQCSKKLILKYINEKERSVCSDNACGYIVWNNPIPVVLAIVEVPEGVILAHNRYWPPEKFSVITGFLESGETPEEGVKREVMEELGLHCVTLSFINIYPFLKVNQLILAYHVKAEGNIILNEELDAFKIISKEQLKNWNFGAGSIPAITKWLKITIEESGSPKKVGINRKN